MKFKCSACTFEENITNVRDFKAKYVRDGYAHCPMCNHPTPVKSNKPKPPPMLAEIPPEAAVEVEPVEPSFKTCPDCAEDVKFAAAKCRYCSYSFVEKPVGEYGLRETLVRWAFFAVFFLILFVVAIFSNLGFRFKTDNAMGATANATESIQQSQIWIAGIAFYLGGTGIAIIDKLAKIHHRLSQ